MDDIIFRCSSLPNLAGVKGLGVKGQNEAIKAYIEQRKGRTKEIKAKYLEKGNYNEPVAIDLVNEVLGTSFVKNQIRLTNEWITGECDVEDTDEITDIKCSWDYFTFTDAIGGSGTDYEFQLVGYMELYNKPKSRVIYCLTDMPYHLLNKELEKEANRNWDGDLPDLIAIRMIKNLIFDKDNFHEFINQYPLDKWAVQKHIDSFVHIPKKERVYQFKFERLKSKTDFIYGRVTDCRTFLKKHFNEQIIDKINGTY